MSPVQLNAAPRSLRPVLSGGTHHDGRQQQEATCEGGRSTTPAPQRRDRRLARHSQSRRLGGVHRERDPVQKLILADHSSERKVKSLLSRLQTMPRKEIEKLAKS